MPRLSANDVMLHKAMEDLLKKWDRTALAWRDQARRDFEKNYLAELEPTVKAACNAMKSIYALLRKIERECS